MKTIRNTALFNEISDLTDNDDAAWDVLFNDDHEFKDNEIPIFYGVMDRVIRTPTRIYFIETGSNGQDNDFVIMPEIKKDNK